MLSNLRNLIKELPAEVRAESREPRGLSAAWAERYIIPSLGLKGEEYTDAEQRGCVLSQVEGKSAHRTDALVSLSPPFPVLPVLPTARQEARGLWPWLWFRLELTEQSGWRQEKGDTKGKMKDLHRVKGKSLN